MSRAERYKNSPTMKRDEDSGKMAVSKAEKKSSEVNSGTDGMQEHEGEGMPAVARHAQERREMFNRHETEHSVHEAKGGKAKEEMHKRHEEEMKAMHKRHGKEGSKDAESKKTTGSGGGKEKIEKVEKE